MTFWAQISTRSGCGFLVGLWANVKRVIFFLMPLKVTVYLRQFSTTMCLQKPTCWWRYNRPMWKGCGYICLPSRKVWLHVNCMLRSWFYAFYSWANPANFESQLVYRPQPLGKALVTVQAWPWRIHSWSSFPLLACVPIGQGRIGEGLREGLI